MKKTDHQTHPDSRLSESLPIIAVIIPCYRVAEHISGVIRSIGDSVSLIFVVDDACPEQSGDRAERETSDPRVKVLRHEVNQGVGAAVLSGYAAALSAGADVIVKIDGDGQMDPSLLDFFVSPILNGSADYTKGNRFYDLRHVLRMPPARLAGNACLSFLSKLSTGYWSLFDPTNGYTAIHARAAERLPTEKLSKRYFFETDMLFRMNTQRCVVVDIPMDAIYGSEKSNLKISRVLGEFAVKHARNTVSRIFYNYFLRDFSIASLELLAGMVLIGFGGIFGAGAWLAAARSGSPTPLGTIMLAVLPTLLGVQFLLAFIAYDMASAPNQATWPRTIRSNGLLRSKGENATRVQRNER